MIAVFTCVSAACVTRQSTSLLAPSPVIVPDAATVPVGASQVFAVLNADVVRFDVSADHGRWTDCVAIDNTFAQANSIRLVAQQRCGGLVYVLANIGSGRSPVAAMMKVQ